MKETDDPAESTVIQLILAGERPDPEAVAELLGLDDHEFRAEVRKAIPVGLDEETWIDLLSPDLVARTAEALQLIARGIENNSVELRAKDLKQWQAWNRRQQPVRRGLSARRHQVAWARRRHAQHQNTAAALALGDILVLLDRLDATGDSATLAVTDKVRAAVPAALRDQLTARPATHG